MVRGRPAQLPVGTSAWDDREFDAQARAAWLLRVSRLTHPQIGRGSLAEFSDLLRQDGVTADASRVSGWESGRRPFSTEVVMAYERVLGAAPGQLLGPVTRLRIARDKSMDHAGQQGLDDAFAPIGDQHATGRDWLQLARVLTTPGLHVPSRLFEEPARDLALETMRSVGAAFSTRSAALQLLIASSPLGPVVVEQVLDISLEQHAQSVVDLIGSVVWSPDPTHLDHAVSLLGHHNPRVRLGIALGLVERYQSLGFDPTAEARLHRQALTTDTATRSLLAPILRRGHVDATGVLDPGRLVRAPREVPLRLIRAGREATGIAEDPMYERLVREALLSQLPDREELAFLLLSHSPYRSAIAGVIRELLAETLAPALRRRVCALLTWVAGPDDIDWLVGSLSDSRSDVAEAAAMGLAHSSGVPADVDLDAISFRHPERTRLLTYAAGMSGHPALEIWSGRGDLHGPARWWRERGAAVLH